MEGEYLPRACEHARMRSVPCRLWPRPSSSFGPIKRPRLESTARAGIQYCYCADDRKQTRARAERGKGLKLPPSAT